MLRRANGIASLLLLAVFSAHAVMGALFCWGVVSGEASWVIWIGVCVVVLHVVLSIGTTRQMLHDEERLPSAKKKTHQSKKWGSGIAVGAIAVAHALLACGNAAWIIVALLLDVALATHICISAKSLVRDLGLASGLRYAIRVLAIVVAVFTGLGICVSIGG